MQLFCQAIFLISLHLLPAGATDSIFSCVIHIKEGLRKTYMEKAPEVSKEYNRGSIAQTQLCQKDISIIINTCTEL